MFLLNEFVLEWISHLIGSNLIEKQHFHPLKFIKLLISRLNQLISRFLGQALSHFLPNFSLLFYLFLFLQWRSRYIFCSDDLIKLCQLIQLYAVYMCQPEQLPDNQIYTATMGSVWITCCLAPGYNLWTPAPQARENRRAIMMWGWMPYFCKSL